MLTSDDTAGRGTEEAESIDNEKMLTLVVRLSLMAHDDKTEIRLSSRETTNLFSIDWKLVESLKSLTECECCVEYKKLFQLFRCAEELLPCGINPRIQSDLGWFAKFHGYSPSGLSEFYASSRSCSLRVVVELL
ncbi:hypothetical protein Pelo_16357 [Pelomyxa schiedti]|nr:hypothetical protein Pelo_16357 [Pelomyxa schiedti]